jgi:hypothetical protein
VASPLRGLGREQLNAHGPQRIGHPLRVQPVGEVVRHEAAHKVWEAILGSMRGRRWRQTATITATATATTTTTTTINNYNNNNSNNNNNQQQQQSTTINNNNNQQQQQQK